MTEKNSLLAMVVAIASLGLREAWREVHVTNSPHHGRWPTALHSIALRKSLGAYMKGVWNDSADRKCRPLTPECPFQTPIFLF